MRTISILFITVILLFSSCKQKDKKVSEEKVVQPTSSFPVKPEGWVSDFERILTQAQINYLDSMIDLHQNETTNQIAIVTSALDTSVIKSEEDFNNYSLSLFNEWGVGTKEKDNGVGILISMNLKRIRIEIGKGLVTKFTNEESKKIIDSVIVPEFRKAEYFAGISKGLDAIIERIK